MVGKTETQKRINTQTKAINMLQKRLTDMSKLYSMEKNCPDESKDLITNRDKLAAIKEFNNTLNDQKSPLNWEKVFNATYTLLQKSITDENFVNWLDKYRELRGDADEDIQSTFGTKEELKFAVKWLEENKARAQLLFQEQWCDQISSDPKFKNRSKEVQLAHNGLNRIIGEKEEGKAANILQVFVKSKTEDSKVSSFSHLLD